MHSVSTRKSTFELASLGISRQRCLNDLDFLSGNNRVGWVDDDLIICLEARHDFYLIAEIVSGSHRSEHNLPIFHNSYA